MFVHAWSGCDTTSSTFGHGKLTIIKYLKEKEEVRNISKIFCDLNASHLEITEAGIRLFLLLYGAKQTSLRVQRYTTYNRLNSFSKTKVKPEKLPPTELFESIAKLLNEKVMISLISDQHSGVGKTFMDDLNQQIQH